jgi:hypothetical protein
MQRRSTGDENVDPRVINIPAIVRMPAIYSHIRPPRVINVERIRTVTVSYEYENPDGTVDVYTQLFPYKDAKAIWRDELARYILSDRWWHRRDDIYGWAYEYYEKKHNIQRGTITENDPRVLPYRWSNMARQVIHHQIKNDPTYDYAFVDTACDTCGLGGSAWVLDTMTERKVQIAGYDHQDTIKDNVPIGSGITAIDLPDGETILLKVNEATILGNAAHSLLSVIQLRENGIEVDDKPRRHGGTSCMMVDDYFIPFILIEGMVSLKIRKPTSHELDL